MNNLEHLKRDTEKLRRLRSIIEDYREWVECYESGGGVYGDMTDEDYKDFKDTIVNLENDIEELERKVA